VQAFPLTIREANTLVSRWHRHHKPVRGHRFSIGVEVDGEPIGCAVVGRPVSREIDWRRVCEVTRLVTNGHRNACSFLYSSCARAAQAMGFTRIQTYILDTEPGTSLKAAGWRFDGLTNGGTWNCVARTGRREDQPMGRKQRWVRDL
jgi:hypothetical protein